jgi:hypothetical protein
MGDDIMARELGRNAMTKKWVALFVSILLFSGAAVAASSWSENFSVIDTDGNGAISRAEWDTNQSKLSDGDTTMNPTLKVLDTDGSNSIDQDEWIAAEKIKKAYGTSCKASESSWCPCQNHPELAECQ